MKSNQAIRLYELVLANGRSASPYVWRIRYALAHKGLPCEPVGVGFMDIAKLLGGRFKTVPIIEQGETSLAESWDIAEYLDQSFPDRPPLFATPAEHSLVRLFDAWFTAEVVRKMFGLYVLDVHDAARPEDRGYFRRSREQRLKGITLEAYTAGREARLPALRDSLGPLRTHLARFPFLGGAGPNYADYIAISLFIWVSSVSTLPLLAHEDSLRSWIDRCLELYGGLGRDPRAKSLFE